MQWNYPKKHRTQGFFIRLYAVIFIMIILLFSIMPAYFFYVLHNERSASDTVIIIEPGTSIGRAAKILKQSGVIESDIIFELTMRFYQYNNRYMKAGEYQFNINSTLADNIQMLIEGEVIEHRIRFTEGILTFDLINQLNHDDNLKGMKLSPELYDEGIFMPDTYHYNYNTSRAEIVDRLARAQIDFLKEHWQSRDQYIPLKTPQEAVVLASIIEKEAGNKAEMPLIASVYINRLMMGMKLQADPTVIYAITLGKYNYNRVVLYKDLKIESPYNTYLHKGLPPGAICNPSREAILAALNPATTEYLYFVADGRNGHRFARTYKEHQANVDLYKKTRAKKAENLIGPV